MSGKATFIVIIGFTILFMVAIRNFGNISGEGVSNMVGYYSEMIAHNIAVSGANLAANQIFVDPTWQDGYSNESFSGGTVNVSVNIIDAYKNIRQITSTGSYHGMVSVVQVTLSPSKFSKFAYYSVSEGSSIWWMAKDTVWGPFHTQDNLRVSKHPTFYGKASSLKSIIYQTNKTTDKPNFLGGYESGVNVPLPTDAVDKMETPAVDNGHSFTGHDTVYICFARDSIKYKYSYSAPYTTEYLPDFAPNGIIFAKNSVLRLQGTVKGQYTVACNSTTSSTGKGSIWLDDNIVYDKDPRQYPTSTDMLGICAENYVWITNNTPNRTNINIQASIYSEKFGFGAQDYSSGAPRGTINLFGGIIHKTRAAVGQFSGTTVTHGYSKSYRYDERFMLASPPYFPGTGGFEIVSWLE